jgi:dephospho-CoA kinase
MKMKIIAFAGMPCSGKSEAVDIAGEMNIPVIRMGDMVWEEVKNRGLTLDEKNVGAIADQMRRDFGMDIWARRTLNIISQRKKSKQIIIDGVRNIEEIDTFKKKLGKDFIIIAVTASDKTRQKRFSKRGREDDSLNVQDLKDRDKRELKWGLGTVIASADIIVPNEEGMEKFKEEIRNILNKM